MAKIQRLDIEAIRSCLLDTQENFNKINASLTVKRTPPTGEVIENLVAGYAQIDYYLANDIDLFKIGNSELLLELNHLVLYHSAGISIEEDEHQFTATKKHFYDINGGGIGSLMDWLNVCNKGNIYKQAASVFTHILSQPQLFIEGNHRTGSLIMSYFLVKAGHSPFVLSYENAKYFFEPAELTKKRRKKALLDEFLHLPKQTRKFAKLLQREQNNRFYKRLN